MRDTARAGTRSTEQEVGLNAPAPEPPGLHAAMRTLRIDAATAEVVGALRDAGVPSILLMGPSVARWIHDIDRPEDRAPPAFLRDWSPLARRGRWGLALAQL